MAKKHEQLLDEIVSEVEKQIAKFGNDVPDLQRRIYDKLLTLAKDLEVKDGRLKNTVENIKRIGELKAEIEKIVLNKPYLDKVMDFAKAFNLVADLQNNYFSAISVDFKPSKVLKAIKNDAIQATVNQLTEAGITAQLTEPIQNILRRNITTGGSFSDMMEQMREYITTTTDADGKKSLGALERYTQQITTDSLNQFSATYNNTITADLGFEWFQYTGSLLETSRPWCKYMVKKRYVHKSELQTVIDDNIDGVAICSEDIPCNKKTGLPQGMIKGTNASNITQRRGGWQCGHQFGGIPETLVPENIRKKFEGIQVAQRPVEVKAEPKQKTLMDRVDEELSKRSAKVFRHEPAKVVEAMRNEYLSIIKTKHPESYARYKTKIESLKTYDELRRFTLDNRSSFNKIESTTQGIVGGSMGYKEKGLLLDKKEFDEVLKSGKFIELRRGVKDDGKKTAKQMIEDFKDGEMFDGHGIFGDGTYFDFGTKSSMPGEENLEFAASISYADMKPENVFRAALTKDAKLLDHKIAFKVADDIYTDLKYGYHRADADSKTLIINDALKRLKEIDLPEDIKKIIVDLAKANFSQFHDIGTFATALGYDGIIVRNLKDADQNTLNYINLFNRTKLIIEK